MTMQLFQLQRSEEVLRNEYAELLRKQGFEVIKERFHIDILAKKNEAYNIIEIKAVSANPLVTLYQAVGQVLWYKHKLLKRHVPPKIDKLIIAAPFAIPPDLEGFLKSLSIVYQDLTKCLDSMNSKAYKSAAIKFGGGLLTPLQRFLLKIFINKGRKLEPDFAKCLNELNENYPTWKTIVEARPTKVLIKDFRLIEQVLTSCRN